ncbi:MAG: hypothetical protein ACFCUX_10215 [Candidatus Methylacidiphilales bacterium]
MKTSPYDIHWNEAKNWKWHVFYVCKDDPRVIVPKKPKWAGRTLNFAHRKAYMVLLFTVVAISAPFALLGHIGDAIWWVGYLLILIGMVLLYYSVDLRENK